MIIFPYNYKSPKSKPNLVKYFSRGIPTVLGAYRLPRELHKWTEENRISYKLALESADFGDQHHAAVKLYDIKVNFDNPGHEMLFKLTWI
jgi:hypothetical protein